MKRKDVIRGKGKLGRRMEKALWRWAHFVDKYCRTVHDDNPYWHNERGSVGILAAAIWSTGGIALEEHPAEKKQGRRTKPRRLDIWCSMGGHDYVFEAKQRVIGLAPSIESKSLERRLRAALKIARKEKQLSPGYGNRVGLVFVVPWVRATKRREPDEVARLLRVLAGAIERCDACFAAWCFQPKGQSTWSYWPRRDRTDYYYWPGVAVIGRALKRQ